MKNLEFCAMKMFHSTQLGLLSLCLFTLIPSGCTVGPNHQQPAAKLPATFAQSATLTNAPASQSDSAWWETMDDPILLGLIHDASLHNHDLRIAASRIREARAIEGGQRSQFWPSIDAQGGVGRTRVSKNTVEGQVSQGIHQPLEIDNQRGSFDLSWEIDVFGGTRRAAEAAGAETSTSIESGREWLITVLAEVGVTYAELRGTQLEASILNAEIGVLEHHATLSRDRAAAGLASELDQARSEARLSSVRATRPQMDDRIQRSIHRLAVLTGRMPAELTSTLRQSTGTNMLAAIPIPSIPSELLRRRPDIRRAERELAAACARVGVAKADLFPRFYLTGAAGLQSIEASDFLDSGSKFWTIGPGMRWPVFQAGKLRNWLKAAGEKHEASLIRYEKTVLNSIEETENALMAVAQEQARLRSLRDSATASRRALELSRQLQASGLADYLAVLESEQNSHVAQAEASRSERILSQNIIRLYKALGGGWESASASSVLHQVSQTRSVSTP